jgi:SAM-dependent MidA family methyltransferase
MDCNMNPPSAQARSPAPPSPAFLAYLRARAGSGGVLNFRDFVEAALYAPEFGYYVRTDIQRVGRQTDRDFYTASSLGGGIFGRLLRTAAANLLHAEEPNEYTLVEIAAETAAGVFGHDSTPFARVETRRLGDALTPPSHAVIFANEWLDAQPFHRFVFRRGAWRELGVCIHDEALEEVELPEFSPAALTLRDILPPDATDNYHLDFSLDAEKLLRELAAAPWCGCLMLADYGYDWEELVQHRPAGTARAYSRHEVSGDLLARPGEQDLTCHVCWDRLEAVLFQAGFKDVRVERQEAFFMRHSAVEIEQILSENPGQFSPARQTLLELLHPAHLGQKFQILSAHRE